MNKEKPKNRMTQIYLNLQKEDTNDLLSIWKRNDKEEWTDDAFQAIRDILLDRLGSLPSQNENVTDAPQQVEKALQYIEQADAFIKNDEIDKALQESEAAIRTAPHLSLAYNHLGELLMRAGRTEEAIGKFQESLRLNPKDADAERNFRRAQKQLTKPQRIQRRKQTIRFMWQDGLSFGLIWMFQQIIIKVFPYHLMHLIPPIFIETAMYALSGACSATVLGYRIRPQQKSIFFALGGALACGSGYLGGVIPGYQLRFMPDHLPYVAQLLLSGFPITLAFLLMGAFLGAVLGIIEKEWMSLKWLILAGTIGFSFYFLVTFIYSNFILRNLPISMLVEDPYLSKPSRIVLVEPPIIKNTVILVRGMLSGLASGALLGYVLRLGKAESVASPNLKI